MELDLTESAIDEFYGMVKNIGDELKLIRKTMEIIAVSLDSIARNNNDTKKGGEA